jgi:hypothetical protein
MTSEPRSEFRLKKEPESEREMRNRVGAALVGFFE